MVLYGTAIKSMRALLLCCAVLCCPVLCVAVLCSAVLCCAVLCCAVLCCAVLSWLCGAVLCCAVLCGAVLLLCGAFAVLCFYYAVLLLCCAMLCCTALHCTVLYNNRAAHASCFRQLKYAVTACYLRVPFQLASPPGFRVAHIPKGNLAYIPGMYSCCTRHNSR